MWLCEHIYVPTTRVIQVCPHVAVANNPNLNPETRSEPSHGSLKLCAKVSKCPHKVLNWQWFSQRQPHTRAHTHTQWPQSSEAKSLIETTFFPPSVCSFCSFMLLREPLFFFFPLLLSHTNRLQAFLLLVGVALLPPGGHLGHCVLDTRFNKHTQQVSFIGNMCNVIKVALERVTWKSALQSEEAASASHVFFAPVY